MTTKKATTDKATTDGEVLVSLPRYKAVVFLVRGITPLVLNSFNKKIMETMLHTQEEGQAAKNKKQRVPKDVEELFQLARHVSPEGWDGIHAMAFRNAMIDACRMAGFHMTSAKQIVDIVPDGYDRDIDIPLVRILKGAPRRVMHPVRLQGTKADIRIRAMWDPGWEAMPVIEWDADQLKLDDIVNLMIRAGRQVGIGEGRPFSRNSAGCGWGQFKVVSYSLAPAREFQIGE